MRYLLLILFFVFVVGVGNNMAQTCDCNCEQPIPDTMTTNVYLNVTGTVNDDLASLGQGVCEVCVKFKHTLLPDLEMILTSPSGQSVTLIGDPQIATQTTSTAFSTFDVCFLPSTSFVNPYGATQATWTNNDLWPAFAPNVTGTYYPHSGILEDFNMGPVNGTWTLGILDDLANDSGQLLQFSITFCDPVGVDCFPCESDAGEFVDTQIELCREDAPLIYAVEPTYTADAPDSNDYNYITFLTSNDTILLFSDTFNFDAFPLTHYEICGLSYLRYDSVFIPDLSTPITVMQFDSLLGGISPLMCGDITNDCVQVYLYDTIPELFVIDTVCLGQCSNIGSISYCQTGNYRDTLVSPHGCDSVVNLRLTVLPPVDTFLFKVICPGDSVAVFDTVFKIEGIYNVEGISQFGCDSIVDLDLRIYTIPKDTFLVEACLGDTVQVLGTNYMDDVVVEDTLTSIEGCDSIIFIDLQFLEEIFDLNFDTLCFEDTLVLANSVYFESGVYLDTFTSMAGCDSIIETHLFVFPEYNYTLYDTICLGDTIAFNGNFIYEDGFYEDTLLSSFGCDSIIHLFLTVNPSYSINLNEIICEGDTVFMGGLPYTESGVFRDTIPAMNGCDSALTLVLFASPIDYTQLIETICSGDTFYVADNFYNTSGIYFDTLQGDFGCDSIVNLILDVAPPVTDTIYREICLGDSTLFNGQYYSIFGLYEVPLKTAENCDSLAYLRLTVFAPNGNNINTTLCQNDSIYFNDQFIGAPGEYYDTLINEHGCDSILHLTLNFLPSFLTEIDTVLCPFEIIEYGDLDYSQSGSYRDTIVTSSGCDSILDLTLSYYMPSFSSYFDTLCLGDTIHFLTKDYTVPGMYSDTLTDIHGCDSIISIDINLRSFYEIEVDDTFCLGSQYDFGGSAIMGPGIYKDTLMGINTCDTILTLNLSQEICNLNIMLSTFPEDCLGNGTLVIQMEGGVPVFSITATGQTLGNVYSLMTNDYVDSLFSLVYDNYFVEVTDFNGNVVNDFITVGFADGFELSNIMIQDYDGYNTSCFDVSDGAIDVVVNNGVAPITYTLDGMTTSLDGQFQNITSGWHYLEIEDNIGCSILDSVFINPHPQMDPVLLIQQPNCLGDNNGAIEVLDVFPGMMPFEVAFDDMPYDDVTAYPNLSSGDYNIQIKDALGCIYDTIISLEDPLPLFVELLDSYTVDLGNSLHIEAFSSGLPSNIDTVMWDIPWAISCDSCLDIDVLPLTSTFFSVTIVDVNGCVASANSEIIVVADHPVFVPTVFTPNGDGENDLLQLFPAPNVDYFMTFSIYDRWGAHIFQADDFDASDARGKWDGRYKGQLLNSGVYMYYLKYKLKNGFEIEKYGDLTLLR